MARRNSLQASDLRGAARLATDATAGLTNLVEAMHERIARIPGFGKQTLDGRTSGITGLVYKTIRGATRVAGGSIEALLGLLTPALSPAADNDGPSPEREAILAALNGVLGDYLAATANPLATAMAFRHEGKALELERTAMAARLPEAGPRLLVLLHGLCRNDLQWLREGHDHGATLARELGFTPVYLHYNSGLHVSANGRAFAAVLEQMASKSALPIEELIVVAHSMGGLVTRSACHYGAQAGHAWPAQLKSIMFLGTPHHGAPLERGGNWVDIILGATRYARPFARLGKIRSAGITDLRYGNLLDEDWAGRDRFARARDARRHVPLPEGVRCCAIAASTSRKSSTLKERLLGDGLVPLASALGQHKVPARSLAFPVRQQWVGRGMNHLDLLSSRAVYARMRTFLGQ